jgi:hypothetical protein
MPDKYPDIVIAGCSMYMSCVVFPLEDLPSTKPTHADNANAAPASINAFFIFTSFRLLILLESYFTNIPRAMQ